VVSHGRVRGGTRVALEEARDRGRPTLCLDLYEATPAAAALALARWLEAQPSGAGPLRLNVAGARASEDPDIYAATRRLLVEGLELGERS